ncbi:hypothetical protein R6Q59_023700 [Mikania micrantha]
MRMSGFNRMTPLVCYSDDTIHSVSFLIRTSLIRMGMAGYKVVPKNNICANLDATTKNARHFTEIITFFRRSRIFTAISTVHVPYLSHQRDFWSSSILIVKKSLMLSEGRSEDKMWLSLLSISDGCVDFRTHQTTLLLLADILFRGCFMRCKYDGNLEVGVLNKAFLCPQFKYVCHVLIHCLGSRRGGFDDVRETLQCAFVALVLRDGLHRHEGERVSEGRQEVLDVPEVSTDDLRCSSAESSQGQLRHHQTRAHD